MVSFPDLLLRLDSVVPSNNSIEKIFGLMLYGAIKHTRPAVVLELGTAVGYSTAWMLLALSENEFGHLYTVDLVASDSPIWKQVGLDTSRLTYLSNEYIDTLRDDARLPAMFDFVFHDAGHNVIEVERDLSWVLPRLAIGGSLVVHDTVYNQQIGASLRAFFEDSVRSDFWKWEEITEASGVGIATRLKGEEIPCKDESNGLMTSKDMVLSREKTGGTISPISPKSRLLPGRSGGRSKKTRMLYSSRLTKRKAREQNQLATNNGAE